MSISARAGRFATSSRASGTQGTGQLMTTWTQPATLAIQGEMTHVAVAGQVSGTVTLAANVTLPSSLTGEPESETEDGLALMGYGDITAMGIPFVGATAVIDLRKEMEPSVGFYIQAPSDANPLGMVFPAQADFGVLLRTDGLAMASAVGLQSFFTKMIEGMPEQAEGGLEQGQIFFETAAAAMLTYARDASFDDSAVAELLENLLASDQSIDDLTTDEFLTILRDALALDDVLAALAADGGGQDVAEISDGFAGQADRGGRPAGCGDQGPVCGFLAGDRRRS